MTIHKYHRLYDTVKKLPNYFCGHNFVVAEVEWDYRHEFDYPDDYEGLYALGYRNHHDAAIHCWLEKYYPDMDSWLRERDIKWLGVQSGDSDTTYGKTISRAFMVVCVGIDDSKHATEFLLAWG